MKLNIVAFLISVYVYTVNQKKKLLYLKVNVCPGAASGYKMLGHFPSFVLDTQRQQWKVKVIFRQVTLVTELVFVTKIHMSQ